jgi:hypothetical protein
MGSSAPKEEADLAADYPLDGDMLDHRENGGNEAPFGGPSFVSGASGESLNLRTPAGPSKKMNRITMR